MTRPPSMLPVAGAGSGRLTTGLIAVFVFLAGCTFSAASYIDALIVSWNRSVSGTITVQLPPVSDRVASDARAAKALEALRAESNVARAELINRENVAALLKPWLADDGLIADLPLPILIDVAVTKTDPASIAAVTATASRAVPGATVDDHRAWLSRVVDLADGFRYLSAAVFGMITTALALTIVFATRAGLTEAGDVVEVLHLFGARDGTIATQFARRAAWQCLTGGVSGIIAFAPALALIFWLADRIDDGILPAVDPPWTLWAGLAALPFAATVLSAVTAHVTVRRSLKRMV